MIITHYPKSLPDDLDSWPTPTNSARRLHAKPMTLWMANHDDNAVGKQRDAALESAVARYCGQLRVVRERSLKTERAYRCDLQQFCAVAGPGLPVGAMTRSHVEAWLADMRRRGYKPSTLRRKIACIQGFLRQQRRCGTLSNDPFDSLVVDLGRDGQLTRTLSDREFELLLTEADRGAETSPNCRDDALLLARRDQAMIWLLCGTGLRVGELVELKVQNTNAAEGVLRVDGKGRRQRLAFTVGGDRERLARYLETRALFSFDNDRVFVNHRGRPITTEGVRGVLARLARACNCDRPVTPHMLRHTAATRLLQNGANLRIVQEFLGHSSIRMTERYTHVSATALRRAVTSHSPLRHTPALF